MEFMKAKMRRAKRLRINSQASATLLTNRSGATIFSPASSAEILRRNMVQKRHFDVAVARHNS
jgi:hypothetical protein